MKTHRSHLCVVIITGIIGLSACKTEKHMQNPSSGTANFSRYISVGNSITSGYADGGLYRDGQLNSYPSIIAQQLQKVGGGPFTQSLFSTDQANGSGHLILNGFNQDGSPIIQQVTTNLAIRGNITVPGFGPVILYTKYSGDLNNYGVPGIKLQQITFAPYGNLNGFFERLLPGNAPNNNTTYLDFVTAKPFTFFTDWLGNNDALGYATGGGVGDVLTDKSVFSQLYNLSIGKLTASGQKGAVANIPNVVNLPYFTTVTIAKLLAGVQKVNPSVKALYVNALVSGNTYAPRIATTKDLAILNFPTDSIGKPVNTPSGTFPYGLTPNTPIANQNVLDEAEIAKTEDYINSYNETIQAAATAKGLALFDVYTFFNNIKAHGISADGINFTSDFITGGIFSLDGVHLTPRGYAFIANEFIKSINAKYGSSIPEVKVSSYRGVLSVQK